MEQARDLLADTAASTGHQNRATSEIETHAGLLFVDLHLNLRA
jgi:hypothetical protein